MLESVVPGHPFGVLTRRQSESQVELLGGQAIIPSPVLNFLMCLGGHGVDQ
jgi:hypothetical protein